MCAATYPDGCDNNKRNYCSDIIDFAAHLSPILPIFRFGGVGNTIYLLFSLKTSPPLMNKYE